MKTAAGSDAFNRVASLAQRLHPSGRCTDADDPWFGMNGSLFRLTFRPGQLVEH